MEMRNGRNSFFDGGLLAYIGWAILTRRLLRRGARYGHKGELVALGVDYVIWLEDQPYRD